MIEPPSVLMLLTVSPNAWLIVALCMVVIAFFSGMEIAFLSASRLRIELRSKENLGGGKWLSKYVKNPSDFISTVLVGNNLGLVVYGIYMGEILDDSFANVSWMQSEWIKFLMITLSSTMVVLVVAEYLPKTFFKLYADRLIFGLIGIFRMAHVMMWPLIQVVKGISAFLLRVFTKTRISEHTPVFSKVDLDNYIASLENAGNVDTVEIDTEVFRNALDFSDAKVRDFMVHRTELVGVDVNASVAELREKFVETAHSTILIYKENIDHIIGFVHHSDLFHNPQRIQDVLRSVLIVNESLQAHDMLRNFMQEKRSLAVVVDEFGGTAGMVSVEDVLEEIVGEIEDEFDVEDKVEIALGEGHYVFSTRLEVDYLNEKYDLNIPEGEYNTLGGYIIFCSERIPTVGEIIHHEPYEFVIKTLKGARLEEVEIRVLPKED
ncbi:MAG: HlyC/CorC family transporter [Sphingomonadales bacterium]|nr:HlyC/CorC family transporter [Sphingomonadales bacterium]